MRNQDKARRVEELTRGIRIVKNNTFRRAICGLIIIGGCATASLVVVGNAWAEPYRSGPDIEQENDLKFQMCTFPPEELCDWVDPITVTMRYSSTQEECIAALDLDRYYQVFRPSAAFENGTITESLTAQLVATNYWLAQATFQGHDCGVARLNQFPGRVDWGVENVYGMPYVEGMRALQSSDRILTDVYSNGLWVVRGEDIEPVAPGMPFAEAHTLAELQPFLVAQPQFVFQHPNEIGYAGGAGDRVSAVKPRRQLDPNQHAAEWAALVIASVGVVVFVAVTRARHKAR